MLNLKKCDILGVEFSLWDDGEKSFGSFKYAGKKWKKEVDEVSGRAKEQLLDRAVQSIGKLVLKTDKIYTGGNYVVLKEILERCRLLIWSSTRDNR